MRLALLLTLLAWSAQAEEYSCQVTASCGAQFDCDAAEADCLATRVCGPVDYVWAFTLARQEDGSWLSVGDPDEADRQVMRRLGADPLPLTLVAPARAGDDSATMLTLLEGRRMILTVQSGFEGGHTETVFGTCEVTP